MAASTDVTLRTAYVTAAFCSLVAVLYAAIAVEPAPILLLFISFAPLTAVCLWLQKDARHAGISGIQDWGFFLWLFWPVVIPWYAFKTRGLSGWRLAAGLIGLAAAPIVTLSALNVLVYVVTQVRGWTG